MIQYTLKCENDHRFDSWFQSAKAFDKLKAAGMVTCSICGNASVEKALMSPRVRPARNTQSPSPSAPDTPQPSAQSSTHPSDNSSPANHSLTAPTSATEKAIAKLKKHVEENSDYVGPNFAAEARAMHDGDTPERAIYGEANLTEAKKLIDDGIPVAALPFLPGRKIN